MDPLVSAGAWVGYSTGTGELSWCPLTLPDKHVAQTTVFPCKVEGGWIDTEVSH